MYSTLQYFLEGAWSVLPIVALTFIISFVVCAFAEHWIHSFVLHSAAYENDPRYAGHVAHHLDHDHRKFKAVIPGETFGLGFWMFFKVNAVLSLVAAIAAYSVGNQFVFWTGMLTAGCYFTALEAIHRRVHVPKENGWFETTALYRHLDLCHQVHHVQGDRNFSIVAPSLADYVMGTFHPMMTNKSTT